MRRQTSVLTVAPVLMNAWLAALSTRPAGPLLAVPTLRLCTGDVAIGPETVVGDLTEATFGGYAPVAVTLSGPVTMPNGGRALLAQALFEADGTIVGPGEAISGYELTNDGSPPTILYAAEAFAEVVQFAAAGDFLTLDVYIPIPTDLDASQAQ